MLETYRPGAERFHRSVQELAAIAQRTINELNEFDVVALSDDELKEAEEALWPLRNIAARIGSIWRRWLT